MEQIKNHYPSIEQMSERLLNNRSSAARVNTEVSFADVLKAQEQKAAIPENLLSGLRFSKHANERLQNRNIDLSREQVKRLETGAARAQEKGIKESLVIVDEYAFIVNTRHNIVITAVDGSDDKIFTNIDGAVIS